MTDFPDKPTQGDLINRGMSYGITLNDKSTKDKLITNKRLTRYLVRQVATGNENYKRLIMATDSIGTMEEGVGTVGDVMDGLKLVGVNAEPMPDSNTLFLVTQEYIIDRDEEDDEEEVKNEILSVAYGSRVSSATTTQEIDGGRSGQNITYKDILLDPPTEGDPKQRGKLSVSKPSTVLRVEFATDTNIRTFIDAVGTTNAEEFFSFPLDTLLCIGFDARPTGKWSKDKITQFRCSYEFQYNPDTWTPQMVFQDATTKLPAIDAKSRDVVVYRTTGFKGMMGKLQGTSLKTDKP